MDRKDTPLIQKIDAIAKVNNEIITRIELMSKEDIIIGYDYTLSQNMQKQSINVRSDLPSKVFSISDRKITKNASEIINAWCPVKELQKIDDFFNDNLDYNCNSFSDIIRLNKEMVRVSKKYVIFDCTQTAINVISSFLDNIEILQTFLGEIETLLSQSSPSKLEKLTAQINSLNKTLEGVAKSVVEVNEDEQKIKQKIQEKENEQLKLRTTREIMKQFPGFTLAEAEEKALAELSLKGTLLEAHISTIKSWLGGKLPKLIYRGSRDGNGAENFHQKCNNKGETLTVIKSTEGYLFGGYTPIPWTSRGNFAGDQRTFIFTLTNSKGIPPTKYSNSVHTQSIYDNSSYGPTFGGGHDISVWCGSNNTNYINFPSSFTDSTGHGRNTFSVNHNPYGTENFQITEIEVFYFPTK